MEECIDAYLFLKKALEACKNKPVVYVDRGSCYNFPGRALGLRLKVETFGKRNVVEQWFSLLKERLKRFWKRFPFRSSIESVLLWIESFAAIYNLMIWSAKS